MLLLSKEDSIGYYILTKVVDIPFSFTPDFILHLTFVVMLLLSKEDSIGYNILTKVVEIPFSFYT